MLTTVAQRVKEVRARLEFKDQVDLANALKVEQVSVSNWERGKTIGNSSLEKFETKLCVRKEWLLFGSGDMFIPGTVVKEPAVAYGKPNVWSEDAIRERFSKVLKDYGNRKQMQQKQICDEWDLNDSHVSSFIHGRKSISTSMLIAAIRYGNVNLNYIMGGVGGFYNSLERSGSSEMKELIDLVRKQGERIEQLSTPEHKKRA